jgi:hypothetical protein
MTSVVATSNVIARPADFEIETGPSSAESLSHMLTMMRKYKNAAMTAASMAATAITNLTNSKHLVKFARTKNHFLRTNSSKALTLNHEH